jgi:hypothetical protein
MPRIDPPSTLRPDGRPWTNLYGHAPTIADGTRALDAGITAAGRIPPQLRKLMNVKAASMVGCPF